jgi:hypothetical protein
MSAQPTGRVRLRPTEVFEDAGVVGRVWVPAFAGMTGSVRAGPNLRGGTGGC